MRIVLSVRTHEPATAFPRTLHPQNTEEGKMRRFKLPEPWGDVVEVRAQALFFLRHDA